VSQLRLGPPGYSGAVRITDSERGAAPPLGIRLWSRRGSCGHALLSLIGSLLVSGCVGVTAVGPEEEDLFGFAGVVWPPGVTSVFVAEAGDDGASGTAADPFRTIARGLLETRASDARGLVIGPGVYEGSFALTEDPAVSEDSGLRVVGAGADASSGTVILGDASSPVFDVYGASASDIEISELRIEGGWRPLIIRGGAGSDVPISFEDIVLAEPLRLGVMVAGASTVAHLTRVDVESPLPDGGAYGWGISVQSQAALGDEAVAPTVLDTCSVTGATEIGVIADGAWLDVSDLFVDDTSSRDGVLGRGVQLQNSTFGLLSDLTVNASADAGVFIDAPGRLGQNPNLGCPQVNGASLCSVSLQTASISGAIGAAVPGTLETSGDALVVARQPSATGAAQFYRVEVEGVQVSGPARSRGVVDGVTLVATGNGIFGDGTLYLQSGAVLEGSALQDSTVPAVPLGLNLNQVGLDVPPQ